MHFKFRDIPEGNGLKVYLHPRHCEWISSEVCSELWNFLEKKGYYLITDLREIDENTFFFTYYWRDDKFKTNFQEKILDLLNQNSIKEPKTIEFDINKLDQFPFGFVVKAKNNSSSKHSFRIINEEQLKKFRDFCKQTNLEISDLPKYFKENYLLQQYIPTPNDSMVTLRVFTSESGDIIYYSLKYLKYIIKLSKYPEDIVNNYLFNVDSRFYLGENSILTNSMRNYEEFPLIKGHYFSEYKKELISAHDIIFDDFVIPDYIKEFAKEIATSWEGKTFLGAISEMRFVYNQKNQRWYYLGLEIDPKIDVYNYEDISGNYMFLDSADMINNIERKWLVNANARLHSLELFAQNQKKKNLK